MLFCDLHIKEAPVARLMIRPWKVISRQQEMIRRRRRMSGNVWMFSDEIAEGLGLLDRVLERKEREI